LGGPGKRFDGLGNVLESFVIESVATLQSVVLSETWSGLTQKKHAGETLIKYSTN